MQCVDFGQANACATIGSAYNGCIRACGQVKHEGRFRRIWWCESVFPNVDCVNIILPVVVGCDLRASRVVDCQCGIAQYSAYTESSERWAKSAYNNGGAVYVS